eukprot:TRINITY_DN967_c0_g2_i2.p1 TRINITY_DN967_c0_g2~~TRINITY_DN967_c0_g2_i2.p1  ORF type:complete len:345 (+),score=145.34 TRINITY_DN967_c0_g2_i2:33-1067(+)
MCLHVLDCISGGCSNSRWPDLGFGVIKTTSNTSCPFTFFYILLHFPSFIQFQKERRFYFLLSCCFQLFLMQEAALSGSDEAVLPRFTDERAEANTKEPEGEVMEEEVVEEEVVEEEVVEEEVVEEDMEEVDEEDMEEEDDENAASTDAEEDEEEDEGGEDGEGDDEDEEDEEGEEEDEEKEEEMEIEGDGEEGGRKLSGAKRRRQSKTFISPAQAEQVRRKFESLKKKSVRTRRIFPNLERIMFAFGDAETPDPLSVYALEDILMHYTQHVLRKLIEMEGPAARIKASNLLKLFEDDDRKHPRLVRILDYVEKKRDVDAEQNTGGTMEQQKKSEEIIAKLYKDR